MSTSTAEPYPLQPRAGSAPRSAPGAFCGATQDDFPVAGTTADDTTTTCTSYQSDPTNWLVDLPSLVTVTHQTALDAVTRTTKAAYDTRGHLTDLIREPNGSVGVFQRTMFQRDANGVVTGVVDVRDPSDTSGSGPSARTTQIKYDTTGQPNPDFVFPSSVVNALGQTSLATYRADLGVPTAVVGIDGLQTGIEHDGLGRITAIYPADSTSVKVIISHNGVLPVVTTQRSDMSGNASVTIYDRLGRPTQVQQQNGVGDMAITDVSYDAMGRVASRSRPHAADGPRSDTTFTYDRLGRATQVQRATGCNNGNCGDGVEVVKCSADSQCFPRTIAGYAYAFASPNYTVTQRDGDGRSSAATYAPQGRLVASVTHPTVPDAMGNPSMATATTKYGYGAFGTLKTVTDAADNVVTMTYDVLGRQTSLSMRTSPPTAASSRRTASTPPRAPRRCGTRASRRHCRTRRMGGEADDHDDRPRGTAGIARRSGRQGLLRVRRCGPALAPVPLDRHRRVRVQRSRR